MFKKLFILFLLFIVARAGYRLWQRSTEENKWHNDELIAQGSTGPHHQRAFERLQSSFDSPDDFSLISFYSRDMNPDSKYWKGDLVNIYFQYRLRDTPDTLLAIVIAFQNKTSTICAPCDTFYQHHYDSIYHTALDAGLLRH